MRQVFCSEVSILTKCSMPKGWFRAYLKSTLVENHSFERHHSPLLTISPARNRSREGRWGLWCGPGRGQRCQRSGDVGPYMGRNTYEPWWRARDD